MHLLADRSGRPLLIENTGARGSEKVLVLLAELSKYTTLKEKVIEGDKRYDAYYLRRKILQLAVLSLIPYRSSIKEAPTMKEACEYFNCSRVR